MMNVPFTKMHGAGNDFVVIDTIRNEPLKALNWVSLSKVLLDRHFGIGADQLLVLEAPSLGEAAVRMRIFNPDGSEVEMCGNGIRCVALYSQRFLGVSQKSFGVETPAGVVIPSILGEEVQVDMGLPILDGERIPVRAKGHVKEKPLEVDGVTFFIHAISMGNPHCVIEVKDESSLKMVESFGPKIEHHPFFPNRTNVEFVWVESTRRAKVRVWERGAGLTLACGSGACAVGVALRLSGKVDEEVTLELPGGALRVGYEGFGSHVYLKGSAAFVFFGEYPLTDS
jgi:diaminopimelate epimerase